MIFMLDEGRFWNDNTRTCPCYQKVDFTTQSSTFQCQFMDKLSEGYRSVDRKKLNITSSKNLNFNIIYFENKSLILFQADEDMLFKDLKLNQGLIYYRNDKKMIDDSIIIRGNNWLSYRSKLVVGHVVENYNVQIKFYVIYTSMSRMISMGKVDLIGLDDEMDAWLRTAIGYQTDCNVEILDVDQRNLGHSFGEKVYEAMNANQEVYQWLHFFNEFQPKLQLMTISKWRSRFKDAMLDGYQRSKCLFIDQVYHSCHNLLHEALYANFSMMHRLIWTYRLFTFGFNNKAMASLARASAENKKSSENRKFYAREVTEISWWNFWKE
jgi:hypothetical protein